MCKLNYVFIVNKNMSNNSSGAVAIAAPEHIYLTQFDNFALEYHQDKPSVGSKTA